MAQYALPVRMRRRRLPWYFMRFPRSSPAVILRSFGFVKRSSVRELGAVLGMSMLVLAVYGSIPSDSNSMLIGLDYWQLHVRRMRFARDALFSAAHTLPGWYPRELLGTPFWSNTQNFPFIPTRLLTLFTMDPSGPYAYAVAVVVSAVLAALFTYLYLRKLGCNEVASAAGGWTFACNGFYGARIAAGHLPLLEAYPALPLLMWVAESLSQAQERAESARPWLAALAFSTACVMLAGHPQLPVYAISVVSFYLVIRRGFRGSLGISGFVLLGVGLAAFALIPMGMLIARSTRVLPLAVPHNDIAMPYGRLVAFFFPWRDGAPRPLGRAAMSPFESYPNWAYFWETVSYAGLLPWLALALLVCFVARRKFDQPQRRIAKFILTLAVAGIVLSLPFVHGVMSLIPATIFRSPARLIYLTEFALAAALAWGVHTTLLRVHTRLAHVAVSCILMMHVWDLAGHSREFIMRVSNSPWMESKVFAEVLTSVGDGRIAMDYRLTTPVNRIFDDIGFFDSIMLARTYRMLLSLGNMPADLNVQSFDGSEVSSKALAAAGVKAVITTIERQDLPKEEQVDNIAVYNVPFPAQRAQFFDARQIRYLTRDEIHAILRDPNVNLSEVLLLPRETASTNQLETEQMGNLPIRSIPLVKYRRPDSDHIQISVASTTNGYLRVIESWDPGWSATINGSPVPIVPAMDALLAVAVPPGRHEIRFVYRTPGAYIGRAVSLVSLILLCYFLWLVGQERCGKHQFWLKDGYS